MIRKEGKVVVVVGGSAASPQVEEVPAAAGNVK